MQRFTVKSAQLQLFSQHFFEISMLNQYKAKVPLLFRFRILSQCIFFIILTHSLFNSISATRLQFSNYTGKKMIYSSHYFLQHNEKELLITKRLSLNYSSSSVTDHDIDLMNMTSLGHLESELRTQNTDIDKEISSLQGRLHKLQKTHFQLEKEKNKVDNARAWESRQKDAREKELISAKEVLESKRSQLISFTKKALTTRESIHELDAKLKSLRDEDKLLEDRYSDPKLLDIISEEAEALGPIPEELFNKTVEALGPDIGHGIQRLGDYRRKIRESSGINGIIISFLLYVMVISICWAGYQNYLQIGRKLTLSRMMFILDMGLVLYWCICAIFFGMLGRDALSSLNTKYADVVVVIEILLLGLLCGNVILRCFGVSRYLSVSSISELGVVVLIVQHYYQTVWVPILLKEEPKSTIWSYFAYMLLNGTLGIYRARMMKYSEERTENMSMDIRYLQLFCSWVLSQLNKILRKYFSLSLSPQKSFNGHCRKSSLIQEYRDYYPVKNRVDNGYGQSDRRVVGRGIGPRYHRGYRA